MAVVEACRAAGLAVRTTGRQPQALPDYLPADVLRPETLAPLVEGVDCVVHAAGTAHRYGRAAQAREAFAANARGVENVLTAAARAGARQAVLVSSVSVYGPHQGAAVETDTCRPDSVYGKSKLVGELMARRVAHESGMALTIVRLATVYGEGDPGNIARLMRAIDRRRFVWVGSGDNRKSLIHRDDVGRACLAVIQAPAEGTRTFNVSAPACSMRDVVEGLAQALDRRVPRVGLPARPALAAAGLPARMGAPIFRETLRKWLADDVYSPAAFRETFGWEAAVPLAEGLRREVAWYRGTRDE
jgi:nucleoside-diphosphate-sugar epimerase